MIVAGIIAAWVMAYAAAASVAMLRAARRRPSPSPSPSPSWVLVRPLAGDEPGLDGRLRETGGASLVIFAVGDERDGATAVAQHAAAELRRLGTEVIVLATHAVGPNHKADQLGRALAIPRARAHPVIVVADSDVDLRGAELARLLQPLASPDVAVAWAPPVENGAIVTFGDRASRAVLDASLHAFPLLAHIDRNGLVGKLFAVRRDALDAIGGFEALSAVLGEDMELARRLRANGQRVAVASMVARSMAQGRSLQDVLARYTRWLLVVRTQRPQLLASYPLLLAPSPLMLLVLMTALSKGELSLAALVSVGLVVRIVVACAARAAAGLPLAPLRAAAQALLADGTLLVALFKALVARDVRWRGRTFPVSRRQQPREKPLGKLAGEARRARVNGEEFQRFGGTLEGRVDPRELAFDAFLLEDDALADVALRDQRLADRDPQVGLLRGAEDVTEPDRYHHDALRDSRDLRGAGPEREAREGRSLLSLGEDPERATAAIEEPCGMTDGARSIGGVIEVDTERPHAAKEGHASQVRRIHHRVPVTPEEQLGGVQRDQRIPPRRVVRDREDGRPCGHGTSLVEARHQHASERALDARAGVAGEPRVEPAALGCRDHEASS